MQEVSRITGAAQGLATAATSNKQSQPGVSPRHRAPAYSRAQGPHGGQRVAGPKEAHCRGSMSQSEAASGGEGFVPPQLPSSRGCGDMSDGLLTQGHIQALASKPSAEKNESRSPGRGTGPLTASAADL